jgi:hypothetical protein
MSARQFEKIDDALYALRNEIADLRQKNGLLVEELERCVAELERNNVSEALKKVREIMEWTK